MEHEPTWNERPHPSLSIVLIVFVSIILTLGAVLLFIWYGVTKREKPRLI